ncbi:hypothetical protein PFISCL1PPCAC_13924 [Pristionchus fissidentatus]|uniref:Transcriptional coactivator p15 (PC4) C-terminal domain-containing protein n=1 Tax=Pristionchus fissidentatus TaxID=1538716 RepID=A0AAV5VSG1_9BILA|nr:hypothetical protein PFISCL1PPCAC_13924 [Pristionchus fissidentatus]
MSDSDSEQKKPKKADKKKQKRERLDSSSDEGVNDPMPVKKKVKGADGGESSRIKTKDGNELIEIGKMKFASVSSFKGQTYVDIREFYMDKSSGEMKPGKKGISLNREQYANFKKIMAEIDEKLEKA